MSAAILALAPLARGANQPLHVQISERIRAAFADGTLRPGDKLPPEAELARRIGVARLTLRQALDNLAREGLIERRHGTGTFIAGLAEQARTAHTASTETFAQASDMLAAARVRAEAIRLRREAAQLRVEVAELRAQMAKLMERYPR